MSGNQGYKGEGGPKQRAVQRDETDINKAIARVHERRNAIEDKKKVLEEKYCVKQERNWILRMETERANMIENMFFREFGLVERMGEIQKCLATAEYTGVVSMDVLYTQLSNIERMIDELNSWTLPERGDGTAMFILGWYAMDTSGEYLKKQKEHGANSEQMSEALRNYSAALEVVEESMIHIQKTLELGDIEKKIGGEKERKARWEKELADIGQLISKPLAEKSEENQMETAQRLAEYAAERFRDRL